MVYRLTHRFCPSTGLPVCFLAPSRVFPALLLFNCCFEAAGAVFTASDPLTVAADMACRYISKWQS